MKKIIIGFIGLFLITFQSCLKEDSNVDFSNVGYITEILYPPVASAAGADATGSGLNYFGSGALTYPGTDESDTAFFIVNLASPNPLSKDVPITIGVDNSKLNDNFSSDSITYEAMPDSAYEILSTTGVIPAGKRLDTFYVVFHPSKFDPTKNLGLPITITEAPGTTISANFGTLYLHTIGNPLAGLYSWDFYRWNDVADTTGAPNSTVDEGELITAAPINPTSILLPEGYLNANGLGSGGVTLTFTFSNGEISNPVLSIDASTQKAIDDGGFKVIVPPTLVTSVIVGDPSTHFKGTNFRYYFEIQNSSGGDRKTVNNFVKQ